MIVEVSHRNRKELMLSKSTTLQVYLFTKASSKKPDEVFITLPAKKKHALDNIRTDSINLTATKFQKPYFCNDTSYTCPKQFQKFYMLMLQRKRDKRRVQCLKERVLK